MPRRPFKVLYTKAGRKVGRVAACGSAEGVVRSAAVRVFSGEADAAQVQLDGDDFALIADNGHGVTLEVY